MNFLQFNTMRVMGVPIEDMGLRFKGSEKQKSESVEKPHQQAQYDKLLADADAWKAGGGFDKNYGGSADFNPVAGFTGEQKGALGAMTDTGTNLSELYNGDGMQSLTDSLGKYDPKKTGISDAIGAANERTMFDFQTQVAPELRQGAQGAGQFGSSRHGIAEGLAQDRLSQNMTNQSTQMAYQDQQSWNNNRQNTLNNLSNISKGLNSGNALQYDAGAMQQGQNQAETKGQLEKWAYENNVDVNDLQAYKNLISGNMGGTTKGESTAPSSGGGIMSTVGTVGGAVVGGMFGGPAGAMLGSQLGGAVGGAVG